MTSIRLLSEALINRIAAGEVVERPASVLKELIENSLDAGANRIDVEIRDGGRRLIMVADNGRGMSPDDLLLAVERHATSKLTEETDLLRIDTLGFRGEALPSIGAVSRMTVTSACAADGRGRRLHLSGGRLMKVEDAARDQGTTVEVGDLFFNVPARRKFLKSLQTETAHLLDTAQRYALSRPDLTLVVRSNGQEVLAASRQEDMRTRLARVLGRDTARAMIPVDGQTGGLTVSGFLGPPALDRSRPDGVYLFVNGRPVKDRLLSRAVVEAYRSRLAAGRYPVAVVFLNIDPQQVDVNVHPAKAEVRFRQPGDVFSAVSGMVAETLGGVHRPIQAAPMTYRKAPYPERPRSLAEAVLWESGRLPGEAAPVSTIPRDDAIIIPLDAPEEAPAPSVPDGLTPIGQIYHAYILAQGPEGLYFIDQHAAHERILFERLRNQLHAGSLTGQALLLPVTLEVSPIQSALLDGLLPQLARLGFDLQPFGGQTFVLKAAPLALSGKDVHKVMEDILRNAEQYRPEAGLDQFEEAFLSSLACHAAVKAGEPMTLAEMGRLLADLDRTEVPTHCPHGRPLIFHLPRRDIEKRFKRS